MTQKILVSGLFTNLLGCREVVTFPGFVDCIYLDAPNVLQLDNGLGDTVSIKNTKYVI